MARDGLREAVTKLRDEWLRDDEDYTARVGQPLYGAIGACADHLTAVLGAVPAVPPTEGHPDWHGAALRAAAHEAVLEARVADLEAKVARLKARVGEVITKHRCCDRGPVDALLLDEDTRP
jgi:hypothetical protein